MMAARAFIAVQAAWTRTFPRKTSTAVGASEFERDLVAYLEAVGGPVLDIARRVAEFDLSSCQVRRWLAFPASAVTVV